MKSKLEIPSYTFYGRAYPPAQQFYLHQSEVSTCANPIEIAMRPHRHTDQKGAGTRKNIWNFKFGRN